MQHPVIRFLISLVLFVAVWYVLLQVLLFGGGAEFVGLGVITVLALAAGVVAYVSLGKKGTGMPPHA